MSIRRLFHRLQRVECKFRVESSRVEETVGTVRVQARNQGLPYEAEKKLMKIMVSGRV